MTLQMTREQALEHYRQQQQQLQSRLELTRASIAILDQDWHSLQQNAPATLEQKMLSAIIKTQLLQLHAARQEGEKELLRIEGAIQQASSVISKATLVPPSPAGKDRR